MELPLLNAPPAGEIAFSLQKAPELRKHPQKKTCPDRFVFSAGLLFALSGFATLPAQAEDGFSPLLSSPVLKRPVAQSDVLIGKTARGRFKGDGIYLKRLSPRQRISHSTRGRAVTAFFRIHHDSKRVNGPATVLFVIQGTGNRPDFGVSYFNQRGRNVTGSVVRGRLRLNIAEGDETLMRQRVAPNRGLGRGVGHFALMAKDTRSKRSDTAEAIVRRRKATVEVNPRRGSRPDL